MQHFNFLHPPGVDEPAKGIAPHDECGEKGSENAEGQSNGKAAHRTARFPEQDRGGDQRGNVGIKDRAKCFLIGGLERDLQGFAQCQFFPQSFINQDARIHCEADGEDDACDTRQGKNDASRDELERADQQYDVDQQRETGDHAGEPVIDEDAEESDRQADETREDAGADGIGAESG